MDKAQWTNWGPVLGSNLRCLTLTSLCDRWRSCHLIVTTSAKGDDGKKTTQQGCYRNSLERMYMHKYTRCHHYSDAHQPGCHTWVLAPEAFTHLHPPPCVGSRASLAPLGPEARQREGTWAPSEHFQTKFYPQGPSLTKPSFRGQSE